MNNSNILFQIKSLEKIIARYFIKEGEFEHIPRPTPTQMQIIDYFLENDKGEILQKDLEKVLELRRATVSGVLQTMEKNKLIERITSVNDTRSKKIILNKKAKEIFDRNKNIMKELETKVTKGITEEELQNFSYVIEKMKKNMELIERKEKND